MSELAAVIKSQLRPGTVVRSVPPNPLRLLSRCRLTVFLLIVSLFLVPGILDRIFVVLGLALVTGGLEYVAGTAITALCFFVPWVLSVSVGGAIPMGILGTAGGLYWFLRNGKIWLALLVLGSLVCVFPGSFSSPHWLELRSIAAILLGVIVAKVRLRT